MYKRQVSNQAATPSPEMQNNLIESGVVNTGTGEIAPIDSGSIAPDTITESGSTDLTSAPEVPPVVEAVTIPATDSGSVQP